MKRWIRKCLGSCDFDANGWEGIGAYSIWRQQSIYYKMTRPLEKRKICKSRDMYYLIDAIRYKWKDNKKTLISWHYYNDTTYAKITIQQFTNNCESVYDLHVVIAHTTDGIMVWYNFASQQRYNFPLYFIISSTMLTSLDIKTLVSRLIPPLMLNINGVSVPCFTSMMRLLFACFFLFFLRNK